MILLENSTEIQEVRVHLWQTTKQTVTHNSIKSIDTYIDITRKKISKLTQSDWNQYSNTHNL